MAGEAGPYHTRSSGPWDEPGSAGSTVIGDMLRRLWPGWELDCRSKRVPGSLVGRPLSLSRQEMMVTWSREVFLNLSIIGTLGWMWAAMMRATLYIVGCLPQPWSLHTPGSSKKPHHIMPNVLWGEKLSPVENLGPRRMMESRLEGRQDRSEWDVVIERSG